MAILAHPLFATIVPVWFATIFALSSLAVRGAIIERWVLSSQLDLILPMATPPLGTTARLLIAALSGALGALIGWLLLKWALPPTSAASVVDGGYASSPARYEPPSQRRADAHPDAPARQPIRAHAELGAHGFDQLAPPAVLASAAVAPVVMAPVTVAPQPFGMPALAMNPPAPAPLPRPAYNPFPPEAYPLPSQAAPFLPSADDRDAAVEHGPFTPQPIAPAPTLTPAAVATPEASRPPAPAGFPSPPRDGPSSAQQIASAPLDSLSHVELIERLAIAMRRRQETVGVVVPATQAPPPPHDTTPDATAQALRAALNALRGVQ